MKMRRLVLCITVFLLLFSAAQAGVQDIEIDSAATTLDLNSLGTLHQKSMTALAEKLNAAPALESVDLSQVEMPLSVMAELCTLCPQIAFHLTVPVYTKEADNQCDTFDIDSLKIATKVKAYELKQILQCMPHVDHVIMYNSPYSLSSMESILEMFPDIDFEWTLRFNEIEVKSTATAFSTLKGRQEPRYTAGHLEPLAKYCPHLLGLDVGHNNVHDLAFLSAWPDLRWLIVIDSKVPLTDLSPLADLKNLEYVELFMQGITDISPLAGHEKLLDLNLCHNDIADLSPLYSCVNLERLHISVNPHLSREEIDKLQAALPDLVIETETWQSTGAGWREHPRYFTIYEGFTTGTYIPFE